MITIYHNPRCSKSREGLLLLERTGQPIVVFKYLDEKITPQEIKSLLKKLNLPAIDLVRTKETLWIENYKGKSLTEEEIIEILANNPKLIERPIVINNDKAVIARPAEKINSII